MPLKIDTDIITIVSALLGIGGVLLAIYQTVSARRVKKLYESQCKSKCKTLVCLTGSMTNEVLEACDTVWTEIGGTKRGNLSLPISMAFLAPRINALRVLTVQLADFCETLNDEHEEQFGAKVFPCLDEVLPQRGCLNIDPAKEVPGFLREQCH